MKYGLAGLAGFVVFMLLVSSCVSAPTATLPTTQPAAQPAATATSRPPATVQPTAPVEAATQESTPQAAAVDDGGVVFRQGLIPAAQGIVDELRDASHYRLAFNLSDDLLTVTGNEEVRYTNRESEPLTELYFHLFVNRSGGKITVENVRVNGAEAKPAFELRDTAMRVPLAQDLAPGGAVTVTLDFTIAIPAEMGGNYDLFGYLDNTLVLHEVYPMIGVYDAQGWVVSDPPEYGDVLYVDMSFFTVEVEAPESVTLVASGYQIDKSAANKRQRATFAAGPIRSFYLAAGQDFTVVSRQIGETQVNSYAPTAQKTGAQRALDHAADAVKHFNARFGDYPYTELDVLGAPMSAGGMEYSGVVAISRAYYNLEADIQGMPASILLESVVAHEVGHQWFFNLVGSDQVHEPWLDEAVVQYITGLYYEDEQGEQAAESYRSSWEDRWARVDRDAIPIGMPVGDYAAREYGAIVYGRGPIFVQALAAEIGEETMRAFMQDYATRYAWGIATGADFKALAEEHCACDLTPLFKEWVYATE